MTKEIKVEIGGESVIINKLFGPMIFMDIRITADPKDCCWVIERSTILPCKDPELEESDQWQNWVEWCRIPGQFDWEFKVND